MAKKSIPSCKRDSSPTQTPFSKRSVPGADFSPFRSTRFILFAAENKTSNADPRTSNLEVSAGSPVGGSMFEVECAKFSRSSRRVMGAWWPSRSSKPSFRHFVSGGVFDSLPLRQFECGVRSAECGMREVHPASAALLIPHFALCVPHFEKGGVVHVA